MKLAFWRKSDRSQVLATLAKQVAPTPIKVLGESHGELITNKTICSFNLRG